MEGGGRKNGNGNGMEGEWTHCEDHTGSFAKQEKQQPQQIGPFAQMEKSYLRGGKSRSNYRRKTLSVAPGFVSNEAVVWETEGWSCAFDQRTRGQNGDPEMWAATSARRSRRPGDQRPPMARWNRGSE